MQRKFWYIGWKAVSSCYADQCCVGVNDELGELILLLQTVGRILDGESRNPNLSGQEDMAKRQLAAGVLSSE